MSKPVLFASFRSYNRADNIRAIFEAYHGEKVFICTRDPNFEREATSGKYDLMVTDIFPAVTPGKCIMIWHAIHGGKNIGHDQPNAYIGVNFHERISYVIAAGSGVIGIYHRCTYVPKRNILPYGLPYTDAYVGKHKGDGHTALADKRSYLYVPTFRDIGETPLHDVDYDYIDTQLTDGEILAVKYHPDTPNILDKTYKHIIQIPNTEPSIPYLIDCDVVITDYSSIMFDGFLLGKPCVLFEKSLGYTRLRGMCLNYPRQYSPRYCTTEDGMLHLARISHTLSPIEKRTRDLVADKCDGHACERLCKLIDELKG